jgi:2-dehydropantoate 2-reductase
VNTGTAATKIAVIGPGAIGGYLGARLALAGEDVTLVARGKTLKTLQEQGLTLIEATGEQHAVKDVRAVSLDEASTFDVVLLALKAQQVSVIAPVLPRVFRSETSVVTLQNGVPWWFFQKMDGPFAGRGIHAADPGGIIAANIPVERVVGAVVYPATEVVTPGVIRVIEGNRFTLGELDGAKSERAASLSEVLTRAGFKAPLSSDIRSEIFLKLLGNLVFNPVSALTRATLQDIVGFPATRALAKTMMEEARTVAERCGVRIRISTEKRIAGAGEVGAHRTSMLRDAEAGREMEVEAILGGVVELARLTGTPTPAIDTVYACAQLLEKTAMAHSSVAPAP